MKRPIRADISRADFNEDNAGSFMLQVLGLAVGVGIFTGSFVWGALALFALAGLIVSPYAGVLVVLLAAAWAVLAFGLGCLFGPAVGAVCGFAAFAWAWTVNQSGAQYVRDVSEEDELEL